MKVNSPAITFLKRLAPVAIIFLLMCAAKLWFSMLLFIGFAVLLTAGQGKRGFCSGLCPLGNLQDILYEKKERKLHVRPEWWKFLRWSVFAVFWLSLAAVILLEWNSAKTLWTWVLRLMVLTFVSALILQDVFRKRFWCAELCPVGKVLDGTVTARNRVIPGKK